MLETIPCTFPCTSHVFPQPVVPCSQRSPPSMHPDPPESSQSYPIPSPPLKIPKSSQLV